MKLHTKKLSKKGEVELDLQTNKNFKEFAFSEISDSGSYNNRTMILLLIVWISIIIFAAFHSNNNLSENIFKGSIGCVGLFFAYSITFLPDGVFKRPHKIIWRVVLGFSLIYLAFFIFLLFQDLDDFRQFLNNFDMRMGKPLIEKSYAENCNSWTTFKSQIDIFITAHLFGWLAKTIIFRDAKILWVLSILYEFIEISFRHILPNFWECWWDHLILDIFGCNFLGILLGLEFCKFFNLKMYDWGLTPILPPKYNITSTTKTHINTFINRWTQIRFPFLENFYKFFGFLFVCFFCTLIDLNLFFLKAELYIDTSHWVVISRTIIWGFFSVCGIREFYDYMIDGITNRLGAAASLGIIIGLTELLLVIKWGHTLKASYPIPIWLIITWSAISLALIWGLKNSLKHHFSKSIQK